MRSRLATEAHGAGIARGSDVARGVATPRLRLSAARAAELGIGDITRLPVLPRAPEDALQDPATGDFYFLLEYSDLGGGDVLR